MKIHQIYRPTTQSDQISNSNPDRNQHDMIAVQINKRKKNWGTGSESERKNGRQ